MAVNQVEYQFCMKQFKPAIAVVIVIASLAIGWTVYREASQSDQSVMQNLSSRGAMPVATAGPIRFGAPPPHGNWGSCDNCHTILPARRGPGPKTRNQGAMAAATAPPISPGQKPPHGNWGKCTNCHDVVGTTGTTTVAATMQIASVAPPLGGVWLHPITVATADRLGLENVDGVLVSRVRNPSAAYEAGLREGDVIVRVDNTKVETLNDAVSLIALKGAGDTVKLQVLRNRRTKKIFVNIPQGTRGVPGQVPAGNPPLIHAAATPPQPGNRVAVAVTSPNMGAQVAPVFGRATAFIIYDPTTGQYTVMNAPAAGTLTAGQQAVGQLIQAGVGGVIVGNIGPASTRRLNQAGIRVYSGAFGPIKVVVNQYLQGQLVAATGTQIPLNTRAAGGGTGPPTKIAVATNGPSLNASVARDLSLAPYLLIYDTGTKQTQLVSKKAAPNGGAQDAHLIVEQGASAVIAGNISPSTVSHLSSLGVFAFAGVQGTVGQAIQMYQRGNLQATTGPPANAGATAGRGVTI